MSNQELKRMSIKQENEVKLASNNFTLNCSCSWDIFKKLQNEDVQIVELIIKYMPSIIVMLVGIPIVRYFFHQQQNNQFKTCQQVIETLNFQIQLVIQVLMVIFSLLLLPELNFEQRNLYSKPLQIRQTIKNKLNSIITHNKDKKSNLSIEESPESQKVTDKTNYQSDLNQLNNYSIQKFVQTEDPYSMLQLQVCQPKNYLDDFSDLVKYNVILIIQDQIKLQQNEFLDLQNFIDKSNLEQFKSLNKDKLNIDNIKSEYVNSLVFDEIKVNETIQNQEYLLNIMQPFYDAQSQIKSKSISGTQIYNNLKLEPKKLFFKTKECKSIDNYKEQMFDQKMSVNKFNNLCANQCLEKNIIIDHESAIDSFFCISGMHDDINLIQDQDMNTDKTMLDYQIKNHNQLDLCVIWEKMQQMIGIKIIDEFNKNLKLNTKTQFCYQNIEFNVIIVRDKALDGIFEKLQMRSLTQIELLQKENKKPQFTLIKDIKRMSLIFTDTEDLQVVSKLFTDLFTQPILLNDERGIFVKILSYKNGFSGQNQLGGDYVDVKIIFEIFNMSDKSSQTFECQFNLETLVKWKSSDHIIYDIIREKEAVEANDKLMVNQEFNESKRRRAQLIIISMLNMFMFALILSILIRFQSSLLTLTENGLFKQSVGFNQQLTNAKSVKLGQNITCVIDNNDILACYDQSMQGLQEYYSIDDNVYQSTFSDTIKVYTSQATSNLCKLDSTQTLICMIGGDQPYGPQSDINPDLLNKVSISRTHMCQIDSLDTLTCQSVNQNISSTSTFIAIDSQQTANVSQVAVASKLTCLLINKTVQCFGATSQFSIDVSQITNNGNIEEIQIGDANSIMALCVTQYDVNGDMNLKCQGNNSTLVDQGEIQKILPNSVGVGLDHICMSTEYNVAKCQGDAKYFGNPFDSGYVIDEFSVGNQSTCQRSKSEIRCRGKFYNVDVDAETDASLQ